MKKLKKILIVDDSSITNTITSRMLKYIGAAEEVIIATRGEEAINLIEGCRNAASCPELILLDLNMPGMGGFEFLKTFKKFPELERELTKVIILSASSSSGDKEKALKTGADDFIEKPLTEENLKDMLTRHFN